MSQPFIFSEAPFHPCSTLGDKPSPHGDLLPPPMTEAELAGHLYEVRLLLGRMKVCADKLHQGHIATCIRAAEEHIHAAIDYAERQEAEAGPKN
jgi:hypothetical protein